MNTNSNLDTFQKDFYWQNNLNIASRFKNQSKNIIKNLINSDIRGARKSFEIKYFKEFREIKANYKPSSKKMPGFSKEKQCIYNDYLLCSKELANNQKLNQINKKMEEIENDFAGLNSEELELLIKYRDALNKFKQIFRNS